MSNSEIRSLSASVDGVTLHQFRAFISSPLLFQTLSVTLRDMTESAGNDRLLKISEAALMYMNIEFNADAYDVLFQIYLYQFKELMRQFEQIRSKFKILQSIILELQKLVERYERQSFLCSGMDRDYVAAA